MSNGENEFQTTDAIRAIAEVSSAAMMAEQALDESHAATASNAVENMVVGAVEAAQVELFRQRAQRQRQRGVTDLAKRYDGIASVITKVTLNERVVASAFERYFASIETGIHIIGKDGAIFVGDNQATKLMDMIVDRIEKMEKRIAAEITAMKSVLAVHQSTEGWINPTYNSPAASHEVQLRTRLANRMLGVFQNEDKFIVMLTQLLWNDAAEEDALEMEQLTFKKEVRELAQFIRRTLTGMRNKVTPASEQPAAEAEAATQQAA